MTKTELRLCFKKARQDFVLSSNNESICSCKQTLSEHILNADIINGTIGGYAAMTSELDPSKLIEICRERGHRIALPYFENRDSAMRYRQWDDASFEHGPFGIRQPTTKCKTIEPDTLLIPLVAVDLKGNRLGQGQGHYDRILARFRAERPITAIGVAWTCQIADRIPVDPWDEPLDYIATPDRIIKVKS
ncbi:MAG: 5-formyltetrahydrofolate cyclo-ligase [Pseudomonadota bacterium]